MTETGPATYSATTRHPSSTTKRFSTGQTGRFLATFFAIAVLVTACSAGSDSATGDSEEAVSVATSAENATGQDADTESPEFSGDSESAEFSGDTEFDEIAPPPPTTNPAVADFQEARENLDRGVQTASAFWTTDWTNATIDISELRAGLGGSDTRDGIPPLDNPKYETVDEAGEWLGDNEPGALVQVDGDAWFYPLAIMTSHEIVNDVLGETPVAVTYCPLCNTAIAYDRRVGDDTLRFGVSGLLRKSDLVMWDELTTSLWQQITGEGIVGQFAGVQLEPVSTSIVSFGQLRESFPEALSLSPDTGFARRYGTNPYVSYSSGQGPISSFFVDELDDRLPALSRIVGVSFDGVDRAYPFDLLTAAKVVNDTVGSTPIAVFWGGDTADALDANVIAESAPIGTAVAYDRVVNGTELTFTADGENFVDDQTGSTWNVLGIAVDGDLAGTQLDVATHKNEFWFAFAGFFPGAEIHEVS